MGISEVIKVIAVIEVIKFDEAITAIADITSQSLNSVKCR